MKLPNSPAKYDQLDQTNTRKQLLLADGQNLKSTEDVVLGEVRLVLRSPNGKLWQVSVSNTGVLSTALYVKQ